MQEQETKNKLTAHELAACRELSAKRRQAARIGREKARLVKQRNAVWTNRRNEFIRADFSNLVDRSVRGGVRAAIDTLADKYNLGVKSIERAVYNLN